ncbi:MarR family transcriptional regulator [Streptomyces sp. NPDC052052]|uniref:MarR family transcriptional regulator n=1 Tax=Streptomyces sp. NPDC052052 TaxID=3154756 RepID=UPI003443B147
MATQNLSPVLCASASSPAYPMAKPGYGKRTVRSQLPPHTDDFALLPERERYVAGFVDHLPDGAEMSVKSLAKQLPLYGQQAVGSALTALSVAGHLRRVRRVVGEGEEVRWVFRTFWSRTARDNAWWAAFLDAEDRRAVGGAEPGEWGGLTGVPEPGGPAALAADFPSARAGDAQGLVPAPRLPDSCVSASSVSIPPVSIPPVPAAPVSAARVPMPEVSEPEVPVPDAPEPRIRERLDAAATTPAVPVQPGPERPSPAYLALARLGRVDPRLALSAADCEALEERAAEWLARGVTTDYLTQALLAGLPARVDSPVGFLRHRLANKIPPALPALPDAPAGTRRRLMVECTRCGTPGRPEALPDGLCRPCSLSAPGAGGAAGADDVVGAPGTVAGATVESATRREVRARVGELRSILHAP